MASLQEIKSRLNSVSTTKKITKAMQLVATAKLQKAKNNLDGIQDYYTSVYDMFQDLMNSVTDIKKILPEDGAESTLHILITSDLGLCGAYNSNILKMFKKTYKRGDKVYVLGTKGVSALKTLGIKADLEFPGIGDEPNYMTASIMARDAMNLFESKEINKVNLLHTKFINSVTFEATETQLLPVSEENIDKTKESKIGALTEFEPDAETVLKNALPLYISALIFGSSAESKVSEMSSRRTAMENATDNAEELISKLDLDYNRARQAAITQEINEIVGGSDTE